MVYSPGTLETDPKKQNMALQQQAGQISTNATNIATNTTNIATNTTAIATNTANISTLQTTVSNLGSPVKNSLGSDVTLNNISNYFDGPSVAQGTSGTWFASGNVVLQDTAGAATFRCKLWDGTTVIDSNTVTGDIANRIVNCHLSGTLSTPAANIRISVKDITSTSGKILFNATGESKDSTLTAIRLA